MRDKHTILIGKTVKKLAQLRGGGTALPGLVVEKIDKGFVARTLGQLPKGVIVISGTNGKTTTTKMVVELLRANGLKVFTNKTGSNFIRGIGAALLGVVDNDGKLPHDIAVLELDEAHATHFVRQVSPRYVLVLNVMRDQLDRFGEIDHTARLLTKVAASATEGVVLNRDDPRVAAIADSLDKDVMVEYFSASTDLLSLFVNDDALHSKTANAPVKKSQQPHKNDVVLESFEEKKAAYSLDGKRHTVTMQLTGVYNFLNAAGALALAHMVLGKRTAGKDLVKQLGNVSPAFGRGETMVVNGQPIEMVLVKNPSGFRLALQSFSPGDTDVMIAINDLYADGRDMSWLWDVDFTSLSERGVAMVSGIRAYDMSLRLQYDDVTVGDVETDLGAALASFIKSSNHPKRIFCTYTAMLKLRRELKKYTHVESIE